VCVAARRALTLVDKLGATAFRRGRATGVGERPDLSRPEGADCLPQIGHIVILMMENHSFDNYLGMLGRGDGFTLDAEGNPTATTSRRPGSRSGPFHLPSTTQHPSVPTPVLGCRARSSTTVAATTASSPASSTPAFGGDPKLPMGYWDEQDLPFYSALARPSLPWRPRGSPFVPWADDPPTGRFLIAGTAHG